MEGNNLPAITDWLFHKLTSLQDFGHNMLHLHVAQQLVSEAGLEVLLQRDFRLKVLRKYCIQA